MIPGHGIHTHNHFNMSVKCDPLKKKTYSVVLLDTKIMGKAVVFLSFLTKRNLQISKTTYCNEVMIKTI